MGEVRDKPMSMAPASNIKCGAIPGAHSVPMSTDGATALPLDSASKPRREGGATVTALVSAHKPLRGSTVYLTTKMP